MKSNPVLPFLVFPADILGDSENQILKKYIQLYNIQYNKRSYDRYNCKKRADHAAVSGDNFVIDAVGKTR